jgi:hypothetical protein
MRSWWMPLWHNCWPFFDAFRKVCTQIHLPASSTESSNDSRFMGCDICFQVAREQMREQI